MSVSFSFSGLYPRLEAHISPICLLRQPDHSHGLQLPRLKINIWHVSAKGAVVEIVVPREPTSSIEISKMSDHNPCSVLSLSLPLQDKEHRYFHCICQNSCRFLSYSAAALCCRQNLNILGANIFSTKIPSNPCLSLSLWNLKKHKYRPCMYQNSVTTYTGSAVSSPQIP